MRFVTRFTKIKTPSIVARSRIFHSLQDQATRFKLNTLECLNFKATSVSTLQWRKWGKKSSAYAPIPVPALFSLLGTFQKSVFDGLRRLGLSVGTSKHSPHRDFNTQTCSAAKMGENEPEAGRLDPRCSF